MLIKCTKKIESSNTNPNAPTFTCTQLTFVLCVCACGNFLLPFFTPPSTTWKLHHPMCVINPSSSIHQPPLVETHTKKKTTKQPRSMMIACILHQLFIQPSTPCVAYNPRAHTVWNLSCWQLFFVHVQTNKQTNKQVKQTKIWHKIERATHW